LGNEYMRMKELVQRSGISRSTIHFYLREGLLHPPIKTGRTMAYYDRSHLDRLKSIQKSKMDMRMPLAFLKKKIGGSAKGGGVRSEAPVSHETGESSLLNHRERRKQDIIEAAIRVFATKGYYRTHVQDITKTAGIAKGTFYLYFQNKRDIFIEVVDEVIRKMMSEGNEAIKDEEDPAKRLLFRGRFLFENYSKYNYILFQLRVAGAADERLPAEKVKRIYHEMTELLVRDDISQLVELGVSRDIDQDLLAYAFIGLFEIMLFRMTVDNKYSFDQIIDFLRDFVMNGIARKNGEGQTTALASHID
jgi:AcrR family transcriptional regulator/predicted DNA-binding transcriptional regulator AlpA